MNAATAKQQFSRINLSALPADLKDEVLRFKLESQNFASGIEEEREMIRQQILEKYNITEDDDEETFERKFHQAREDGALNALLLDAYMDGEAYW